MHYMFLRTLLTMAQDSLVWHSMQSMQLCCRICAVKQNRRKKQAYVNTTCSLACGSWESAGVVCRLQTLANVKEGGAFAVKLTSRRHGNNLISLKVANKERIKKNPLVKPSLDGTLQLPFYS